MDIEDMNEEQFREYLKTIPPKDRKATTKLRKENMKAKGLQAPKTKIVENDDGTFSEVQTISDTEDPNKVPDTLDVIPNLSGKEEGETTTQSSYGEQEMNKIANGEKPSKVGAKQIKEVWGAEIEKEEEKEEETVTTPSKNDEGDKVPSTEEVIEEVKKEETTDEEGDKDEEGDISKEPTSEVEEKVELIRRGIWTDYSNGLFGDRDTKGIKYKDLTDEQKKRRNDALKQAWGYTFDAIGTMLWNIGSAFGRKDTYIDNEYTKLLRKQNENIVQNDTDLMREQKEFELKLSQSKQFNNMTPLDQQAYLTFLMLDPTANKDNLLSARNLKQFEKYKLEIETNAVKSSYLGNEKIQATIKNLIKDLDVKNADINKINADISRIAVENKLTEQQVQQILLECEAMQKRIGYIDAHEIADIIGKYGQFANDVTGSIANVVNAFKPSLNINKTTTSKTTRTSPKGTQSTTETTVNETTKKK